MRVRPSRVRRLRIRKAIGNAALAGAVLAVGLTYLAFEKHVTLVVDGRPEAVRTLSANVGELLDSSGIVLDGNDVVVPPEATPLADGMTVVVDSNGLTISAEMAPQDVGAWVMEGAGGPSAKLTIPSTENWFSAGSSVGTSRTVAATVVVLGKDHEVVTNATTVRELLSAMGIELDGDDRVRPSPGTPLHQGIDIAYSQVDIRLRTARVAIPYTTHTVYSDDLRPGEIRIAQAGRNGLMLETSRVRIVDGKVARRVVVSRRVLIPAVAQRRLVGSATTSHGTEVGEASYYTFAPGDGLTAAHPWLPFGTVVTVKNLANGKTVTVTINDRGPFGGRIIDLSEEAFARIAPLSSGVCQVRLTW
ncbi:MAG TPA: ubiquitin-like domain-containing protein [Actinomycetota bacterium]|nr:ubiquitin-like domain-containing protein [Actinomycetota bacterium]